MLNRLFAHLDTRAETVIEWQREMTSRPALSPENGGTGEEVKALWLRQSLAGMGIHEILRYDCPDDRVPCGFRPNIAARLPGKSARTLWVIAHMDVVPPGDDSLWDSPPYELRVKGDYLYGRGVEDNQQAIVTAMLAAEALLSLNITPALSLGLLFVADEETGMTYGLPHVLAAAPALINADDLILVPDMGSSDGSMVEIAEKSLIWFRFTIKGKQCHASTPEQGVNSLVAASACIMELERLYRIFRKKNPLFIPSWSTFVPSKKEANVENVNTLPGRDVFYLDCRILPEYPLNAVEAEVRSIANEVAARYGAQITVDVTHREQASTPTPADAPVVASLSENLRNIRGIEPHIRGVGGQTVAVPLRRKGLPTAVWATLIPNAHAPNEHSRISAAIADAKVVLGMLFPTYDRYGTLPL